jgi:protein-tyrosine phosphatase
MATQLYWADGPWPGKLALASRPRGGDWLSLEASEWRTSGVDTLVSFLTRDEERDLNLANESAEAIKSGMNFISFPIVDREVPASEADLLAVVAKIHDHLAAGRNVAIHCRQGIGRTGLVAACLFVSSGWTPADAIEHLSAARGLPVPETEEQRRWVDDFALACAVPNL